MPWHETEVADATLCHFALGLNEQLASMEIVKAYAFTGKTGIMLLASSAQGRGGLYHNYTPHIAEFYGTVEYPLQPPTHACPMPRMGRTQNGFILTCDLRLESATEQACCAFEAGLAAIRSALESSKFGFWHHTRARDIYGGVFPATSTYVFRGRSISSVFEVHWNTRSYPPPPPSAQLTYPVSTYYRWPMVVSLNVEPLDPTLFPFPGSQQAVEFLEGVLRDSRDKGKGRA